MKYYIILLLLAFCLTGFAQEVKQGEKTYEVKKEKIFLNGEDVTETLSAEEKEVIFKEAAIISEKLKQAV